MPKRYSLKGALFRTDKMEPLSTIELDTLGVSIILIAKTSGSVCLEIRRGEKIQRALGWFDIHYPCPGHIRVQIRGMLPDSLLTPKNLLVLVSESFRWLHIPDGETWELSVCSAAKQVGMSNPVNAEGKTDRLDTMRKFALPSDRPHEEGR
jgi:hypothetical protein